MFFVDWLWVEWWFCDEAVVDTVVIVVWSGLGKSAGSGTDGKAMVVVVVVVRRYVCGHGVVVTAVCCIIWEIMIEHTVTLPQHPPTPTP